MLLIVVHTWIYTHAKHTHTQSNQHQKKHTHTKQKKTLTVLPLDGGGPAGAVSMVALSRKSGLPLGVLPTRGSGNEEKAAALEQQTSGGRCVLCACVRRFVCERFFNPMHVLMCI